MALNLDHQRDRITAPSGNITINTNGSLRLPVGNTAQRPQAGVVTTGQIRFNTQTTGFEGYNGTQWNSLTGVFDQDGDTFISAEENPDDDHLRFFTANQERITISNTGDVTIFTDTTINTDLNVVGNSQFTGLVDIDSQATIASLNVEDLTQHRLVFVGSQGELTDYVDLTFENNVLDVNTDAAIGLPRGSTATRPTTPRPGYIRFNTDTTVTELWDGTSWSEVGSGSVTEAFTTISVNGQTDIEADSSTDTLTFSAGSGITLTTDPNTDTITITANVTSSYGDAQVDAHLNQSTAQANQVLSWDGSDYAWVANQGGGGGFSDKIQDADGDTHIKVETTADEDSIRMSTAGTEAMSINNAGVVTFGDSSSTTYYTFPTTRGTTGQVMALDANGNLTFQTLSGGGGGGGNVYYQTTAPSIGITSGDLWFDTGITGELYVYTGSEWISTTPGADTGFIKQLYAGDGTTTAFDTGTGVNGGTVSLVFLNGVLLQATNDYAESGGVITFVSAPQNGDQIDVAITGSLVSLALGPLGLTNHTMISVDATGHVQVNSLDVTDVADNSIVIAGPNGRLEGDADFTFDGTNMRVNTTGALQIPVGSSAQRPGAVTGQLRYNSTTSEFEGYDGSAWGALGSGGIVLTDLSIGTEGSASGDGEIAYNNATGVFTYTPPDLSTYLTSVAFTDLTTTPTTLAGYGITDAFTADQSLDTTSDVTFNTVSVTAGSLTIDGVSKLETASQTLATTAQTSIDTFATTDYRSCKYTVQATDTVSSEYQIVEVLLIHDGTTAYITTYGIIHTGASEIVSFDADVNAGNVRLLATGASTNSTQYKVTRISTLV
jgi:hypothetical protein